MLESFDLFEGTSHRWAVVSTSTLTTPAQSAHGVDAQQKLQPGASSAHAAASKLSTNTAHLFAMLPWQMFMGPHKSRFHEGALSKRYSARESLFTTNHRVFVMHISRSQVSLLLRRCSFSCSASGTVIIFIRVAHFHTLPFRYQKYRICTDMTQGTGASTFWQFWHCVMIYIRIMSQTDRMGCSHGCRLKMDVIRIVWCNCIKC